MLMKKNINLFKNKHLMKKETNGKIMKLMN